MYSASVLEHLENSTSFLISYKFLQKKKYLIVFHRASVCIPAAVCIFWLGLFVCYCNIV